MSRDAQTPALETLVELLDQERARTRRLFLLMGLSQVAFLAVTGSLVWALVETATAPPPPTDVQVFSPAPRTEREVVRYRDVPAAPAAQPREVKPEQQPAEPVVATTPTPVSNTAGAPPRIATRTVEDPTPLFASLLGRAPTPDELTTVRGLDRAERMAWFLGQDDLYTHWWEQELRAFGLVGASYPTDLDLNLPLRLARGELTCSQVLERLARSASWSAGHPEAEAFARVVLEQVLGVPAATVARRDALLRLHDGRTVTFLGRRIHTPQDALRLAASSPAARRAQIARAWQRVRDAPAPRDLQVERGTLFRAMVEWACRGST